MATLQRRRLLFATFTVLLNYLLTDTGDYLLTDGGDYLLWS